MILTNARIATGSQVTFPGWLRVQDGLISEMGLGAAPEPADLDLDGRWLVPGFVDIHVHGAAGRSFDEGDSQAVAAITGHHLARGTTTMLASLVTAPVEKLRFAVEALSSFVLDGSIAGIHLEGPFLAERHCGAHDPGLLRSPEPSLLDPLLAAGSGTLRMITIAPELPGAADAIRRITDAGVAAAIGHTDADEAATLAGIEAGARVATHLYNGMAPIKGRRPGSVPALLEDERVTIELIADGVHLHRSTLRRAMAAASGRFALVSDAMAATGRGDGDYLLGSMPVRLRHGEAWLADGSSLAGSTLTLDRALRTAVDSGASFLDALAAVTVTPARAVGIADVCGELTEGRAADLVVLDDQLAVRRVMRRGEWVFEDDSRT